MEDKQVLLEALKFHGHMKLLSFCATGSGALFGAYLMKKKLSGKQVKTAIGLVLYIIAVKMIWDLIK